ncbi:hypothetical protein [Marinomonas sp. PE14-40]|uniref:hypothetical protein n=1 Tax=Marinomonas sp. PE14-40 TaxID=3060621 RepID=UPI003F68141A
MSIVRMNKLAAVVSVTALVAGCSLIDDKADAYQQSQTNDAQLIVPEGSVTARDRFVIPNEDKISITSVAPDLSIPTKAIPDSFSPLADLAVTWEDDILWIDTPLESETLGAVIKNFLVSIYGEGDPVAVNTDAEIISAPVGDQDVGSLLKFYYSITRLYPDRTEYRFELVADAKGTKVGMQYRVVSTDKNSDVTYGDWLGPESSDQEYELGLQFISAVSREALAQDEEFSASTRSKTNIWVTSEGDYVLKLDDSLVKADVAAFIEQSDLYLISRNPLELAFVTEGEITKVGDIKPLKLPSKTEGGEDIVLLNLRYRNLDGVSWQKRVYPVDLIQKPEGLFIDADTSATELPNVVSYRIMSALKK